MTTIRHREQEREKGGARKNRRRRGGQARRQKSEGERGLWSGDRAWRNAEQRGPGTAVCVRHPETPSSRGKQGGHLTLRAPWQDLGSTLCVRTHTHSSSSADSGFANSHALTVPGTWRSAPHFQKPQAAPVGTDQGTALPCCLSSQPGYSFLFLLHRTQPLASRSSVLW